MKKIIAILILMAGLGFTSNASATSGACSYHGGVDCSAGASVSGNAICNDGWESSVSYDSMTECAGTFVCPDQFTENDKRSAYDKFNQINSEMDKNLSDLQTVTQQVENGTLPLNSDTQNQINDLNNQRDNLINQQITANNNYIDQLKLMGARSGYLDQAQIDAATKDGEDKVNAIRVQFEGTASKIRYDYMNFYLKYYSGIYKIDYDTLVPQFRYYSSLSSCPITNAITAPTPINYPTISSTSPDISAPPTHLITKQVISKPKQKIDFSKYIPAKNNPPTISTNTKMFEGLFDRTNATSTAKEPIKLNFFQRFIGFFQKLFSR